MPKKPDSTPIWGQVHIPRRYYSNWAATLSKFAKTPRQLPRPKAELSDLELVAALIPDLRADLVQLWEAFTTERAEVARYLMDPKKEALVYLLGFHLANQARTLGVLERVENRSGLLSHLAEAESLRLVDLGAGTAALSQITAGEVLQHRSSLPLAIELVDKNQAFLDVAVHGHQGLLGEEQEIVTRRQKLDEYLSRELSGGPIPGPVWYQLGYVWNEIVANPRTTQLLLRYLGAGLQKGRRIITLIEPANQDLARGAMELREQLLQMGYRVLYPCPHSETCPMLERSRDWCYSEFAWERPPLMRTIDRLLDIDRQRIGCSAYVFVSPDVEQSLLARRPVASQEIVVGRPSLPRGRDPRRDFEYLLCTPEGLGKKKPEPGPELLRGQTWSKPTTGERKGSKPLAKPEHRPAQSDGDSATPKARVPRDGAQKGPKNRDTAASKKTSRSAIQSKTSEQKRPKKKPLRPR